MAQESGRRLTADSKTRCLPRVPVTLPVRFRLCDEDQQSDYRGGWTLDLSVGGILIRCDTPIPDGGEHGREGRPVDGFIGLETELCVQLRIGEDRWVNLTGKIVWMEVSPPDNSHLLGICFTDLDPEDTEKLERFMETSPP